MFAVLTLAVSCVNAAGIGLPTGYYRLRSSRGGYLYFEGTSPQTSTSKGKVASSVVRVEHMSDGGCYLKMQGQYISTPLKDQTITVSDVPQKFYPVEKEGKVAFYANAGNFSALHCGYSAVIGYTLDDNASYWTLEPAEEFNVTSSITKDGAYYTTSCVPFPSSTTEKVSAYNITVEDSKKAVADEVKGDINEGAAVMLRSTSSSMPMKVVDNDHADVEGNVCLRNEMADQSWYYFNKAFLLHSGDGKDNTTYYRTNLSTTSWLYFWQQALVILGVEDRYDFRGDHSVKPLITNLLDAFLAHEGKSWTWNEYNDDLLWAGLAFIRGYRITGEQRFLDQAISAWNLLYGRGYDTQLGGGIWWSIKKEEKSGLSNNPAICMACYLYDATGDEKYLNIAKELYDWVCKTLRSSDGRVSEKIDANGTVANSYNVYNMGTFIEGASALYRITGDTNYRTVIRKTIEYVMVNKVTGKGILSAWKTDGTWQSEFARGMAFYLKADPSEWTHRGYYTTSRASITYYKWLRLNADAAWNTRDKVNNITGCKWETVTPTVPKEGETWESDACVSAVVMTNVVPEVQPGSADEQYVAIDDADYLGIDVLGKEEMGEDAFTLDADGIMRSPSPVSIVCVGNSITEGWGLSSMMLSWPAQLQHMLGSDYTVINCGASGTTMSREAKDTYWTTGRYATAKAAKPQILIIALGTNDADNWRWVQYGKDFRTDYMAMIEEFRANGSDPIIYCTMAPPLFPLDRQQNLNVEQKLIPIVKDIAAELNAPIIDFHTSMTSQDAKFQDGVHPTAEGAIMLAQLAAQKIKEVQSLTTPKLSVSQGDIIGSQALVPAGAKVTMEMSSNVEGQWQWTGPNGFTSTQSKVELTNVQRGGAYSVSFIGKDGQRTAHNFLVSIKGQNLTGTITPYVQVAGGGWQQTTSIRVPVGATLNFGPQYQGTTAGTWTWTGPNGFHWVGREPSIVDMSPEKAGHYALTYTDDQGRQTTTVFEVK